MHMTDQGHHLSRGTLWVLAIIGVVAVSLVAVFNTEQAVAHATYEYQTVQGSLGTSPHDGAPGTVVIISGSAFPRNTATTIYFGATAVGTVTADNNGSFQFTTTVPNLPTGLVAITAAGANPTNPPKFYIDASKSLLIPAGSSGQTSNTIRTNPIIVPTVAAPDNATLQAEILMLQSQLTHLSNVLNAHLNLH